MRTSGAGSGSSWSTWREIPAVIKRHHRRTLTIAITVGTAFFAMNQLEFVLSGRATGLVWLKAALTYLTPLCVSNIGVLSATRRPQDAPSKVAIPQSDGIDKTGRSKTRAIGAASLTALLVFAIGSSASADAGIRANVYRFADGSTVAGAWSSVATTGSGAKMTLQTSELPAGHSVTVWWVIFNEPQNCTHPEAGLRCGPGDLPIFGGSDSAMTSVVYAAGHEIGGLGQATFSGRLATGDDSGALWGPGLIDATGADIHLVVHDHGMLTAKQRAEGIHNFGPCNPTCVDLQFSPHEQ